MLHYCFLPVSRPPILVYHEYGSAQRRAVKHTVTCCLRLVQLIVVNTVRRCSPSQPWSMPLPVCPPAVLATLLRQCSTTMKIYHVSIVTHIQVPWHQHQTGRELIRMCGCPGGAAIRRPPVHEPMMTRIRTATATTFWTSNSVSVHRALLHCAQPMGSPVRHIANLQVAAGTYHTLQDYCMKVLHRHINSHAFPSG